MGRERLVADTGLVAGPELFATVNGELAFDRGIDDAVRALADLIALPGKVRLDRRGGHAEDALGLGG